MSCRPSFPGRMLTVLLLITLSLPTLAISDDNTELEAAAEASMPLKVCEKFNRFNTLVRDGKIDRNLARKEIASLLAEVKAYYYANGGRDYQEVGWVFPLKGYDSRAIGGGKQHGYLPGGYDYFDGNRHKGHPALDIFIHDRDQDSRDDRSGEYVTVLSMTGGVVVAQEPEWQPGSPLRGGKYLWVYDPAADSLVYYAHNRDLLVSIGAIVKPGDPIAQVGRTGFNAFKRRSPTHLHFSLLRIRNGVLRPTDIYSQLSRARLVKL